MTNCFPAGTVTVEPFATVSEVPLGTMIFLYAALESADVKSEIVVTLVT